MHELFTTARLIRRYRIKAGLALKESTKKPEQVQRRHVSLMQRIHEIFGDDTTLTNAVLVNIESQTPGRHREPTPRELYQIARALRVPMLALIIDTEDPFGVCELARSSSPDTLDNSDVLYYELLMFGKTMPPDDGLPLVDTYATTPTTDKNEDPTELTKYALTMHYTARALFNRSMRKSVPSSGIKYQMERQQDIIRAQGMLEYLRQLVIAGIQVPEKELKHVEDAANAVASLWDAEDEVWATTAGEGSYRNILNQARTVIE